MTSPHCMLDKFRLQRKPTLGIWFLAELGRPRIRTQVACRVAPAAEIYQMMRTSDGGERTLTRRQQRAVHQFRRDLAEAKELARRRSVGRRGVSVPPAPVPPPDIDFDVPSDIAAEAEALHRSTRELFEEMAEQRRETRLKFGRVGHLTSKAAASVLRSTTVPGTSHRWLPARAAPSILRSSDEGHVHHHEPAESNVQQPVASHEIEQLRREVRAARQDREALESLLADADQRWAERYAALQATISSEIARAIAHAQQQQQQAGRSRCPDCEREKARTSHEGSGVSALHDHNRSTTANASQTLAANDAEYWRRMYQDSMKTLGVTEGRLHVTERRCQALQQRLEREGGEQRRPSHMHHGSRAETPAVSDVEP